MSLSAAFISVVLIWSTTPLAIKWSAMGAGFSFAVLARMTVGVVLCAVLLLAFRVRFPLHRRACQAYLAGGLSMFCAMSLSYWSAQFVSSGMISVLFGLSPLITSLGAMLWLKEEAFTSSKLSGMLLGVLGLLLVFRGGLDLGSAAMTGLLALFAAVVSQAVGLVCLKRINDDSPPIAMTLGTLMIALPLFFAAWWLADGHWPAKLPDLVVEATIYLGVFGSVLGFALYYYLIKHMEAGRIALITLITPVLALLLGQALNNEEVLPQVWLGAGFILSGLCLHRWGERWLGKLSWMRGR
jgi:drug/metabolite transporter (DMT)-like permease